MDDRMKYMLLKVLSIEGNVDILEKAGYQYAQIANAYAQIINDKLVEVNNKDKFVISDLGKREMERLANKIKNDAAWKIEPYIKYKIEKMDKYDIFIE